MKKPATPKQHRQRMARIFKRLKGLPKDAKAICHFWPHAYCVAKPRNHIAVVVMPPAHNPLANVPYNECETVSNDSADKACVGKWYSLAYCHFPNRGCWTVVLPYQPEL